MGLLATPDTPGAFYKGFRLMALDGTTLLVPDSPGMTVRWVAQVNSERAACIVENGVAYLQEVK